MASHFLQSKYRRFGPKMASNIWIIKDFLSPCDEYIPKIGQFVPYIIRIILQTI